MQTTRKTTDKKLKRETTKDDLSTKKTDEKPKKSIYTVSTPRNFSQKSTASDIYARNSQTKAPKKTQPAHKTDDISPMKDLLKSSPSSVSNRSFHSKKNENKTSISAKALPKESKTVKKVPFKVTVNSPISRRINVSQNVEKNKKDSSKELKKDSKPQIKNMETDKTKALDRVNAVVPERKRTSTRTLDDEEIKVLTPDAVDNDRGMLNLAAKLKAQPKAFFIDIDGDKEKIKKEKSSDEEVSYEDDFESYESDFESYHSGSRSDESNDNRDDGDDDDDDDDGDGKRDKKDTHIENDEETSSREEKMLDSGNFELRDRSATKSKPMELITEDLEEKAIADDERKKVSLVDEGFQDMSSGLSSIKTLHVDVLERPLFIDFTKSNENRRKKRIFERLKQRAQIILSMVTLHEMAYHLFEMAPIPYELYMATYGRHNYKQTAVQTFEDGVTEEIQTDEIVYETKWTQNPVEFSTSEICMNVKKVDKKSDFEQFSFFPDEINDNDVVDDRVRSNPLRIYFEQKDGVGCDTMLSYKNYETTFKKNNYDINRLRKFLKNVERPVSTILSRNAGNTVLPNVVQTSKLPFCKGYVSISAKDVGENTSFLKDSKMLGVIFSETRHNLILTIHDKSSLSAAIQKCVLCLWDTSVTKCQPVKYLIATDNVQIGKFWGSTDGYFVGALKDSSLHLWDLSEEPMWCHNVAIKENSIREETKHYLTSIDRPAGGKEGESLHGHGEQYGCQFHTSAYTSSAYNICNNETVDSIVGLELLGDNTAMNLGSGRRVLRQLCTLQRMGTVTIWSVLYEKYKNTTNDIGQAFWSKMKLQLNQTIHLTEYLEMYLNEIDLNADFNLNTAKKRLFNKRQDRNLIKRLSRQKSLSKLDNDRPRSAASIKNKLAIDENTIFFENGIECCHLKILNFNNVDNFLVGKNYGEVLSFRRIIGSVKLKRFSVSNSSSSVTCLEISPNNGYFLAATDHGTIHLCCFTDLRVLHTLDCRNIPPTTMEKYQVDHKGRFLGTVPDNAKYLDSNMDFQGPILSLSHPHPLLIVAVSKNTAFIWNLKTSDAIVTCTSPAQVCASGGRFLSLLTPDDGVQIYESTEREDDMLLFNTYITLL